MKIAFFGSSHASQYWNGAGTSYRGLLKALAGLGHDITFYEPDAFGQQRRLDVCGPPWAEVAIHPAASKGWQRALDDAAGRDLLVKAAGAGVCDGELSWNLTVKCRSRPAKRSPTGRESHAGRRSPDRRRGPVAHSCPSHLRTARPRGQCPGGGNGGGRGRRMSRTARDRASSGAAFPPRMLYEGTANCRGIYVCSGILA